MRQRPASIQQRLFFLIVCLTLASLARAFTLILAVCPAPLNLCSE